MADRITIIDFVEKYVAKYSENTFLWEKNLDTNVWDPTTYKDTLAQAKRVAAGLVALGVQKGEKISFLSEGRNMWIIGELGVLYAGAVNVPLSIKLGESNDLVFRVKNTKLSNNPHITAFTQIRNFFTFLDSERHKTGGNPLCLCEGLFISCRLPYICIKILFPQERTLRILGNILLNEVDDCQSFSHNVLI